jgi:hypothetical protein
MKLLLKLYRQTITNWIKKYKNNLSSLNDRIITHTKKNFTIDIKFNFNNKSIHPKSGKFAPQFKWFIQLILFILIL